MNRSDSVTTRRSSAQSGPTTPCRGAVLTSGAALTKNYPDFGVGGFVLVGISSLSRLRI